MYSTNYLSVLNDQVGKEFEDAVFEIISKTVSCKRASVQEDKCCGTDLYIEGIPVDVTFNMSHKDHIVKTRKYNDDWVMGIRTGNNYKGGTLFDTPVLVIAFNADDPKYVSEWVIPRIKTHIGSVRALADAISDLYWEYDDENS